MVRQQMGVVMQKSQRDADRDLPEHHRRRLEDASRTPGGRRERAGLAEDIKNMPMGMHTYVSEGGGTLSGGQRQRLMIARAIVNKPKILFLDEATSALDNRSQAIVTESMDKMEATRIVIAHRLSTIINADKICYMEGGKIIEMGNYDELMKMDGAVRGARQAASRLATFASRHGRRHLSLRRPDAAAGAATPAIVDELLGLQREAVSARSAPRSGRSSRCRTNRTSTPGAATRTKARRATCFTTLKRHFIQLRYPIRAASATRKATSRARAAECSRPLTCTRLRRSRWSGLICSSSRSIPPSPATSRC